MRKSAILTLSSILLALCFGSSGAKAVDVPPEIKRLITIADFGREEPLASMSVAQRRELADAAVAYYDLLDRRIPQLSPKEDEWVHNEFNSLNGQGIATLQETPEYALSNLGYILHSCKLTLSQLPASIGGDRVEEFYRWMQATYCFTDSGEFYRNLKQAKLISNGIDDYLGYGIGVWHEVYRAIRGPVSLGLLEMP